jgi:hypothetical protein
MDYRVKLLPRLCVIDAQDQPVADAHVLEISFPGDVIHTMHGRMNTIAGAGAAKIIVGDVTVRGVPLC